MFATFGQITLSLSLLLAFATLTLAIVNVLPGRRDPQITRLLPWLYFVLCGLVGGSALSLVGALLGSDFSVRYVWMYTNRSLEPIYKFTALWGGQEGSMLFWCLILAAVSAAAVAWMRRQWRGDQSLRQCYAIAVFSAVLCFFHTVMFFAEDPFAQMTNPQPDGRGLNPLLQTWSMIIHPPCLYFGYILCTVPFAISVAAVLDGELDSRWIRETRVWTLLAWLFLTAGNLLGANWAYNELGWGGFWAWDPVENAAIMPWFTTTAYLHSIMVQERRGMLKTWNFALVSISFCLTILGTFITRSGLISSVHSFARSNLGYFFLVFLLICIVFCLVVGFTRRKQLKSDGKIDAFLSRETSFIANNILLTVAAFAILWGTLFPIFSELITEKKMTVGPPFFNSFMVPIGLALLALMGFGQTIAWRKTRIDRLVHLFFWPTAAMLVAASGTAILYGDFSGNGLFVLLSFAFSAFVLMSLLQEFWRGMRSRHRSHGENYALALVNLVLAARRRYGGYVVHFGILLVFLGITGVAFKIERELELKPGESTQIGGYTLLYRGLETTSDSHKDAVYARLQVHHGRGWFGLMPARFFYRTTMSNDKQGNSGAPQTSTEVALRSTLLEDLYTVLHTFDPDTGTATFLFTLNPLVAWLWIGGFVMLLGTGIVLLPKRFELSESLLLKKEATLQTIRELDFDHKTEKIADADHDTIKETLMAEVVDLNRRLHDAADARSAKLEALRRAIERDLETTTLPSAAVESTCAACGMPYASGQRFCTQCGKPLQAAGSGKS